MTSSETPEASDASDESDAFPPTLLGALDPGAASPLGRHSFLRRVVAEPVTALMIQRALVMDVAHPKVAAGVEDHSSFRSHPWRRAWVTVDAGLRLVFGDTPTARGAARQIYATHDHINGSLEHQAGPWPSGTRYTAHDAGLLTWVWATLVDSAEVAYTRWVAPFTADEADDYYGDMVAFAGFLGIPAQSLPTDRHAFAGYLETTLAGDLLGATDVGRALAHQILWFSHRSVPSAIVRVGRVLAVTTLDPRLRQRMALELDDNDARYGLRLDTRLRTYYPRLPRARAGLPTFYVRLRRPTIGLSERARSVRARSVRAR
ncbi:MAG TPA: oxygenase MpaB family protein [Acidimicrobiales bacterium]|jgi:uncharacterized protein (DUF2236 family)